MKMAQMAAVGVGALTLRRVFIAGAAALGLYTVGDGGMSYLKTVNRMVSAGVCDKIPVEFELERAKTMIGDLIPDIKRNMVVIAQEEVSVENIREEIKESSEALDKQREAIMALRDAADNHDKMVHIGRRVASDTELETELKRRFAHYRMAEATLNAKRDLLTSREASLQAARHKLKRMLDSKRDLEIQVENLEARLRTVQGEAIVSKVEFDDSHVERCKKLVDGLRVRLQVAERLLADDATIDGMLPSALTMGDEDVLADIDAYFSASVSDLARNTR